MALGHHRFEWLYVTAFVSPESGETFWYLSNGVSKSFFEELLALVAREAGAGTGMRRIAVFWCIAWRSWPFSNSMKAWGNMRIGNQREITL